MSNFGNELRKLRNLRGITQVQLAKDLNKSRSCISMYEKGEREPDFETLEEFADYFNVDMSQLIGKKKDAPTIDIKSMELLELFAQLSELQKDSILTIVRGMVNCSND